MMTSRTHTFETMWSDEDQEWVGLCHEYPSLSWLDADRDKALAGIMALVEEVDADVD